MSVKIRDLKMPRYCLLALQLQDEAKVKECRHLLKAEKGKETRAFRRNAALRTTWF